MLEARSLKKAVVPTTLIQHPSPANLQSNRLSLHVSEGGTCCWVYVASGCHVYRILGYVYLLIMLKGALSHHGDTVVSLKDSLVDEGKDSLLIPEPTQVVDSAVVNRCPHRSEIQTILLNETESNDCFILGSVDSYGHLIVSKMDSYGKDVERLTFSVSPRDFGVGEAGWAGLCFSPSQWSTTAVAHSFGKSIDVYDQDFHLCTFRTMWYPTAVNFVNNLYSGNESSILAVTEGCQLSIWDLRVKEKGGCVHRICGSVGDILYAVCNSPSGNIAVGGADRTMTVYDPRRWSAVARWVNCSKYEITGLSFSSVDPNYAYVQGVDYEVFCGQWRECKKTFSFRGDSNWLGFSKCRNRDVLGGWCDTGSIFVADVVEQKEILRSR